MNEISQLIIRLMILLMVIIPFIFVVAYAEESNLDINIIFHDTIAFKQDELTIQVETCNLDERWCFHYNRLGYVPLTISVFQLYEDDVRLVETIETKSTKTGIMNIGIKMNHMYEKDHEYMVIISGDGDTETFNFWLKEFTY